MWKWLLGGAAALLVALAALIGVRTATYRGLAEAPPVALTAAPEIDADKAAAHLGEAVRIRTISRREGVVEDPAAFRTLHNWLARTYPLTHAAMSREIVSDYSLLYTLEGTDASLPPMLLLAHQDVVPVEEGTEGDWPAPPFSGEIKDGYVIGRGAADDKGSLVGVMEGMEALLRQGFTPRRTIMFAFGHDEETQGSGARAMAALLQARGIHPWFVIDEGMAIVADNPLTGGPVALIGVAEKGYLTVRVTARGEGGHSSRPPHDGLAAERLSRAILAIRGRPFDASLREGPAAQMLAALAPRLGLVPRVAIANQWAFEPLLISQFQANPTSEALLRTTIAPTIIGGGTKENVLPQQMYAIVNLRLHPRDSVQSAVAHLRASVADIPGVTVEIEGTPNEPSPVSRTDSDSYALIASAARAAAPANTPVSPMLVLGATDSHFYAGIAENVYRFEPVLAPQEDLSRIHGTGERMSVENVGRMARFYAQLIASGGR